ncbi:protease Do-like 2, chloroplastic isoform X3 [Mangifera indica]|uniref:protease Do-like 2, chloroplastic isoform X3 n=1 Tax=Mangifera indica TaxID=29780 RepID=UPI001CFBCB2E|nr:protease Do-like 2, chloroplastic isoform X3 [Mangifera indica]XP_044502882.1 protease Do-like 2, chloroplastic isoform X3 [Mangifera indica]XP_044502883.1 protease Do-like 2, chloroplastic isoform X3 [Mangifera indica]
MAMAIAVVNSYFPALNSTVKFRCSISSQRLIPTSQSLASKLATSDRKLHETLTDGRVDVGRSQSTAFKSFGAQRKDRKELQHDSKEQPVVMSALQCLQELAYSQSAWAPGLRSVMVEPRNLQDVAFLNAVVKVYCTHTAPDYSLPWQKQSAFMIGDGKLLTNAHCVEHDTQVKVKRRGDDTKYVAKDAVTVVGYPLGGDTILVTKGVVSSIEVYRSEQDENVGYVIPTTVVSHFLNDYERNGKYTAFLGFPCLGVLLQKLENPALHACLKVQSNEVCLCIEVSFCDPIVIKILFHTFLKISFGTNYSINFSAISFVFFAYLFVLACLDYVLRGVFSKLHKSSLKCLVFLYQLKPSVTIGIFLINYLSYKRCW